MTNTATLNTSEEEEGEEGEEGEEKVCKAKNINLPLAVAATVLCKVWDTNYWLPTMFFYGCCALGLYKCRTAVHLISPVFSLNGTRSQETSRALSLGIHKQLGTWQFSFPLDFSSWLLNLQVWRSPKDDRECPYFTPAQSLSVTSYARPKSVANVSVRGNFSTLKKSEQLDKRGCALRSSEPEGGRCW